jgi:hypothetical protein
MLLSCLAMSNVLGDKVIDIANGWRSFPLERKMVVQLQREIGS